jgi:hypothetical protein
MRHFKGIGLEDLSRYYTGEKAIDAVVAHNTIDMDTPYAGIYVSAVEGAKLLKNRISGHMANGIILALFSAIDPADTVPNSMLIGNNVQNLVAIPGERDWVPAAPIYLGPGASNTLVVGRCTNTNVVDLGVDNLILGFNWRCWGGTP